MLRSKSAIRALPTSLDIAILYGYNVFGSKRKNRLPTLGLSFGIVCISFRLFVLVSFKLYLKVFISALFPIVLKLRHINSFAAGVRPPRFQELFG
jgi:hypothetical protein